MNNNLCIIYLFACSFRSELYFSDIYWQDLVLPTTHTFFFLSHDHIHMQRHCGSRAHMFTDFFLEGGVVQTQKRIPTYVSMLRIPQMIWVWRATVEWYIDRENRRTRIKTCPSATLSTTNPTCTDQGANPGLRSERPATNRLSHGTA
jgi:hypothetical protein